MENEISVADNAPLGPTGIPKSVNSQVNKLFYDEFNVSQCDMAVLYATAAGNPALRDQETGISNFIEELCKELQKKKTRTIDQEI